MIRLKLSERNLKHQIKVTNNVNTLFLKMWIRNFSIISAYKQSPVHHTFEHWRQMIDEAYIISKQTNSVGLPHYQLPSPSSMPLKVLLEAELHITMFSFRIVPLYCAHVCISRGASCTILFGAALSAMHDNESRITPFNTYAWIFMCA